MLTTNVIAVEEGLKVIVGTIDGEKYNVPYSDELLKTLKDKQAVYETLGTSEEYEAWVLTVQDILFSADNATDTITDVCKDLVKDAKTGNYYVTHTDDKGIVHTSKIPVPDRLVNTILESVDKNLDPTPVIKAWVRFMRNPNFTPAKAERFANYITALVIDDEEAERLEMEEGFTRSQAEARATYNDVMLTTEGLVVCKKYAQLLTEGWFIDAETNKAVRKPLYPKQDDTIDVQTGVITVGETIFPEFNEELMFQPPVMGTGGDEFFCGDRAGHLIKVGQKHALESWNQVNTNDNTNCVKGLHIGGISYVSSYKGLNCQLLDCFVDPSEIGAICDLSASSDGAIRVREYFVYGATTGKNKGLYHSSRYAAIKDSEWEAFKAAAIDQVNEQIATFMSADEYFAQ